MTCGSKRKDPSVCDGVQIEAIKRAEGGEGVLPLARKLGISGKLLHDWIKAWKAHGPEGLNRNCRARNKISGRCADRDELSETLTSNSNQIAA
jgi:transposase-like protein